MKEYLEQAKNLKSRIKKAKELLKVEELLKEAEILEKDTLKEGFWDDTEKAAKISTQISDIKKEADFWSSLEKKIQELEDLAGITEKSDHELQKEIKENLEEVEKELEKKEFNILFSGPYDKNNAILSVYAGSGGVDAQDWAEMLLRMFLKFAASRGFKTAILQISSGDDAGIKSVTVEVQGLFAYGNLKSEAGVHRLVRLSPFDADKARHTSFALVDVIPEIETEDYKIDEKDLKVETFRASGHGGQSVNTTDSAVRITHIPSGVTATSQNERSQLQNKNSAMKVLASRLKILEEKKMKKEISEIRGETLSAEWGNQIRSYVLHPYNMVKDHRTGFETSNTAAILEGDLGEFIESFLKYTVAGK